ncbi:MAG: hypothetical protein CAF45_000810 [Nitrospira sp. CG24E]|nr:MAG: hypothetical protein CAF45_000810 [Nitrospira sp. CG24E]
MALTVTYRIIGISLGVMLFASAGFAAEPAEVEKFVKARIEVGEMMMNYFQGGANFGGGQQPSPEQMRSMGADIQAKLGKVLSKHDLTVEEYRKRSPEVFADEAAVKGYLNEHPDLKQRYEALPLDRMGRGGSTGRGY